MEDIINLITSRTGISAAQAQTSIEIVLEQLKNKMPNTVTTQVQNVLAGKEFDFNQILKDEAHLKFENIKDVASEKMEDLKDGAKDFMDKLGFK